jgi:hypothetical protein
VVNNLGDRRQQPVQFDRRNHIRIDRLDMIDFRPGQGKLGIIDLKLGPRAASVARGRDLEAPLRLLDCPALGFYALPVALELQNRCLGRRLKAEFETGDLFLGLSVFELRLLDAGPGLESVKKVEAKGESDGRIWDEVVR